MSALAALAASSATMPVAAATGSIEANSAQHQAGRFDQHLLPASAPTCAGRAPSAASKAPAADHDAQQTLAVADVAVSDAASQGELRWPHAETETPEPEAALAPPEFADPAQFLAALLGGLYSAAELPAPATGLAAQVSCAAGLDAASAAPGQTQPAAVAPQSTGACCLSAGPAAMTLAGVGQRPADNATAAPTAAPEASSYAVLTGPGAALQAAEAGLAPGLPAAASIPLGLAQLPAANALPAPGAAAPTAAATLTAGVPIDDPAWPPALASDLRLYLSQGVPEARLLLCPDELGSIEVHIRLEAGQVQLAFRAEHPMVREVLQAALPGLSGALAQQGLRLSQAIVETQAPGTPGNERPPGGLPAGARSGSPRRGRRIGLFEGYA